MKGMKRATRCKRSPRTLGELVTVAFDNAPTPNAAIALMDELWRTRAVRFRGDIEQLRILIG